MTTYQRGHEPAGAPVTWSERDKGSDFIIEFDQAGTTRGFAATFHTSGNASEVADAICAAFHAAAEWRKLAELAAPAMRATTCENEWLRRFDAMKETFGD